VGFRAIAALRAERWLRPVAQGRGLILTFHHVRPWRERAFAPNRLLEITPDFLDQVLAILREEKVDIVPLDEVPARLAEPGPFFAALTFDDGYRDNLEHAAPVLRRHDAPWTMFVTPGFADGDARLWWLDLEEAVARLDAVPFEGTMISSRSPAEKAAAFSHVYGRLRAGPEGVLRDEIARLAAAAGIDSGRMVRTLCLDWSELAALAEQPGVTIGAHTLSPPMLAKPPDAFARREIVESRERIERALGRPVQHFAYPVGDPTSAGPRDFALAREAGFATAVTTRPGHLFKEHAEHLHALPRVSVNGLFQSEAAFRALLSGVPFLAWNRLRRLNVS